MENKFKESRFIEQIMVIGENQKMPAAFIVPDVEYIKEWAKKKNLQLGTSYEEIATNTEVLKKLQSEIDHYNGFFGDWEKIKLFEVTPSPWTVEGGELTAKLSIRRKEIIKKYQDLYDKIYATR